MRTNSRATLPVQLAILLCAAVALDSAAIATCLGLHLPLPFQMAQVIAQTDAPSTTSGPVESSPSQRLSPDFQSPIPQLVWYLLYGLVLVVVLILILVVILVFKPVSFGPRTDQGRKNWTKEDAAVPQRRCKTRRD